MSASKDLDYEHRPFAPDQFRRALRRVGESVFGATGSLRAHLYRTLPDGTDHGEDVDEHGLTTICDLSREHTRVSIDFFAPSESGTYPTADATVRFSCTHDGFLNVILRAESIRLLTELTEAVEREFQLKQVATGGDRLNQAFESINAEEARKKAWTEQMTALATRVEALEQRYKTQGGLTCFLSFQFSGPSLEYGRQVKHFLELLDVRVITGQGYEPQPISEKVRSRLTQPLDMIVMIEAASGTSTWTRDEIARAQLPNVHLIPLVEDGASFEAGIYGDHERVRFAPGHIGDTFTSILEGVRFIQRTRLEVKAKEGESTATDDRSRAKAD
jgi:hypothetical protein